MHRIATIQSNSKWNVRWNWSWFSCCTGTHFGGGACIVGLLKAQDVTFGLHYIRRYIGLHHFFLLFPYTEALLRSIKRSNAGNLSPCIRLE